MADTAAEAFQPGDAVSFEGLRDQELLNGQWGVVHAAADAAGNVAVFAGPTGQLLRVATAQLRPATLEAGNWVRIVGTDEELEQLEGQHLKYLVGALGKGCAETSRWEVKLATVVLDEVPSTILARVYPKSPNCPDNDASETLAVMCKMLVLSAVPSWRGLRTKDLELRSLPGDFITHVMCRLSGEHEHGPIEPKVVTLSKCHDALSKSFLPIAIEDGISAKLSHAIIGPYVILDGVGSGMLPLPRANYCESWLTQLNDRELNGEIVPLMEAVGKQLGKLHTMPLDWLRRAVGEEEFQARLKEPAIFPRHLDRIDYEFSHIRYRVQDSPILPRKGLFAQPVTCHGNFSAGAVYQARDKHGGYSAEFHIWDFVTLGHRGMDLSFFLFNLRRSTLESRRAFVRGYLEVVQGKPPSRDEVDEFLLDVEHCMAQAGVICMSIACTHPWHASNFHRLADDIREALEENTFTKEQILETGIVKLVRGRKWMIPERMIYGLLRALGLRN